MSLLLESQMLVKNLVLSCLFTCFGSIGLQLTSLLHVFAIARVLALSLRGHKNLQNSSMETSLDEIEKKDPQQL